MTAVSPPAPRPALQQRVATAILDAAAHVLATTGERASMTHVAAEAGVARATVYRYFPSRQALLDGVADLAVAEAGERLAAARIDEVPVEEALARAVRALVDVGDPFVVLVRDRTGGDPARFATAVTRPLHDLFQRAQTSGDLREDIEPGWLADFLVGLVMSVLAAARDLGREDTIALVTTLFLDGARRPRPRLEAVR